MEAAGLLDVGVNVDVEVLDIGVNVGVEVLEVVFDWAPVEVPGKH